MGQQETTLRATGSALRRMILVLAVAALMAVMMVAMAAPAFAASDQAEVRACRATSELPPQAHAPKFCE